MSGLRLLGACFVAAVLGGCGGGGSSGGGTITVSVSYSGDAYLLHSSTITPQLSGFDGHSPQCSLASGHFPAGMSLNGDCSISGIPTEAGSFDFVIHVGASGVSNQLDWNVGFAVFGPSMVYPEISSFSVGTAVDVAPMNTFWQPFPNETVVYSVATGALPAGLTIEARTGRISGVVSAVGDYTYQLRADVTSAGRSGFTLQQDVTRVTTSLPGSRGYPDGVGTYVGVPVDVTPTLPTLAGATFDFAIASLGQPTMALPTGLAFDPVTGRIFGTPTQPTLGAWAWTITEHYGAATQIDRGSFLLPSGYPLYVYYPNFCTRNQPCASAPSININDPTFTGATLRYVVTPNTPLPPGLAIDPVSGLISGTATRQSDGNCVVEITVTRGIVSFVMTTTFAVFFGP